jgi:flagella basal body P-ring formation protein FlgA
MLPLLLVACSACAQDEPAVRIDLRPAATARHAQVVLGEIADIHARDLDTIRQLVSLPLGDRARAGSESIVRREVLERWVRLQLGIPRAEVLWGGAAESVIRTPAQELHASRIESAARDALASWLAKNAPAYRAEALPLSADVTLPAGQAAVTPRPIAEPLDVDRRVTVWVDVTVDDRRIRSVPVNFAIERVGVPAGTSAERSVARGDWVSLRLKNAGVELETRVQALQDGRVGDVVRVRASAATEPVPARVLSNGHVEALL